MIKSPFLIMLCILIMPFIPLLSSEQEQLIEEKITIQDSLTLLLDDVGLQQLILELAQLSGEQESYNDQLILSLNENTQILDSTTTLQEPSKQRVVSTRLSKKHLQDNLHLEELSLQSILLYSSVAVATGLTMAYLMHSRSSTSKKKTPSKQSKSQLKEVRTYVLEEHSLLQPLAPGISTDAS